MRKLALLFFLCASPTFAQAVIFGTPQSAVDNTAGDSTFNVALPDGGGTVSAATIVYLGCFTPSAGTPAWATPSGFTILQQQATPSGAAELDTFYEVFANGATLPANVACALTSGTYGEAGGVAIAYQLMNPSAPIDVSTKGNSSTAGATVVGPAVTTTQNNDVVGWFFGTVGDIGSGAVSVGQGTIEAQVTRSAFAANGYLAYADATFASSGSTGTNTLTYSNSTTQKAMVTVGLAPVAGLSQGAGFGGKAVLGGKAVAN